MKIAFFSLKSWEKDYVVANGGFVEAGVEAVFSESKLNVDNVPSQADFEAISVFVDCSVDKSVLDRLPNLKFIATRSTGYDHIDVAAAKERGIVVSSVPSYGENTVAEYAFALILALSRKICDAKCQVKEEGSFSRDKLKGFDLRGKTLGVVGTGKIGRHVVRMAKGFEMEVVAFDAFPDLKFAAEMGFAYLPLADVLAKSDILTLHVPYMKETHHLINTGNIGQMKKGAYLINTARGAVVETEALVKVLKSGWLSGAGLDVLEEEGAIEDEVDLLAGGKLEGHNLQTILADHVLIDMPNVIVTPHNAFNSQEGLQRILDTTIENIKGFMVGAPVNIVK